MFIKDTFEKNNDEYLKFDSVINKKSSRADLHAFIMLDELFKCNENIISSVQHDEFYLNISKDQIDTLNEKDIIDLIRCGVSYSNDYECLFMLM